jgi:hypothetical protein
VCVNVSASGHFFNSRGPNLDFLACSPPTQACLTPVPARKSLTSRCHACGASGKRCKLTRNTRGGDQFAPLGVRSHTNAKKSQAAWLARWLASSAPLAALTKIKRVGPMSVPLPEAEVKCRGRRRGMRRSDTLCFCSAPHTCALATQARSTSLFGPKTIDRK